MGQGFKMLGFLVIAALYVVIGVMAAKGTICIFRKILTPKSEQVFYAVFLIGIASIYLAFVAYFSATIAWQAETTMVVAFAVDRLAGCAPSSRADRWIFNARVVGLVARTSGAWRPLWVSTWPTDCDPARLRTLLRSLRLLHGGIFLPTTRRVECRPEGGSY